MPPKRLDYTSYLCPFEKLFRETKLLPVTDMSFLNRTKVRLQDTALNALYSYNTRRIKSNVSAAELAIIKNLSADKSIVILKPDKGNGVVIMDRQSYSAKILDILSDTAKFTPVESTDCFATVTKLEDRLTRLLGKLKASGAITTDTYRDLVPSGSRPGILYGLPKIHKPNCPVRPIISAIGSFNHKVARFLVDLLSPLARGEYTIDNTFSFVQELQSLRFGSDVYMCSFDVVSLFTNVPLDEAISICTRAASSDDRIHTRINESYLTQLLNLCTKESVFLFEKKLYKQSDGVAMGSPLGPLLANIFMCFLREPMA